MQANTSSNSSNVNIESTNEDATITEKEKLLREIQDLRCIIKQCEWNLETLRFKDVEERTIEPQNSKISSRFGRKPNIDVDLQNDLYRFAGFHCVKFRREEIIFNFTSTNEQQKDNTYALQIFIKDGKGNLGKWVMPMSVDMNYMLTQTPLDELKNLTVLIKNCKHNVDCYVIRKEQFLSLKKHILNTKHYALQSNIGYTQISLELYNVHDCEEDIYINLIIYLLYHSDKARPHKIEVDTSNKNKLSNDIKQRLKVCFKEFKISDLQTAFDKVLADNSEFEWMPIDDVESPLELNDTSNSDEEGFLVQLQSDRKKLRKAKRKRELQEKWNERKMRRSTSKYITSSKDNKKDSQSETNVSGIENSRQISQSEAKISRIESSQQISQSKAKMSRTKSLRRVPIKEKKIKKIPSISKQDKVNENLQEETTPLHSKSKIGLKQTKLNFQTSHVTDSTNMSKIPPLKSKLHNRPDNKKPRMARLVTSTPLHNVRSVRKIHSSSSLEIDNMTDILTPKQTADKLNDKSSSQLENKTVKKKTSKLLRNNIKSTGLSVHSRTNRRLTRSMELEK